MLSNVNMVLHDSKGKLYLTEFWLSDGYSLEISRSTLAMKVLIGVQRKRYSHSLTEIQIGTLQSVSCRRDVVIWECVINQRVACPTEKGLLGRNKECEAKKVASCKPNDFHYLYGWRSQIILWAKYTREQCTSDCKCSGKFYHQETSKCWIMIWRLRLHFYSINWK